MLVFDFYIELNCKHSNDDCISLSMIFLTNQKNQPIMINEICFLEDNHFIALVKNKVQPYIILDLSIKYSANIKLILINFTFIFHYIFKNVSSSTSLKKLWNCKTLKIQEFSFFLSRTFIYETILIKVFMNANIKKTQIRGHQRSHKDILKLFRRYYLYF